MRPKKQPQKNEVGQYRILVHSSNFLLLEQHTNSNNQPSLTTPDMSIGLKELLDKHTRQGTMPQQPEYAYHDEDDNPLPNPRALDLTDFDAIGREAFEQLEDLKMKKADYDAEIQKQKRARQQQQKVNIPDQNFVQAQ